MAKIRVAVIMGGMSSEHDVSVKSGTKIADALRPDTYEVLRIVIEQDGRWVFPDKKSLPLHEALSVLAAFKVDCVFPALHGPFGEDGRIQGLLDLLQLPYVGSGCAPSALAIDKIRSKALVHAAGIRVPADYVIRASDWYSHPTDILQQIETKLGFPCVAKSPCQGSSLGMGIAHNSEELDQLIVSLLEIDRVILVEQFIRGTEVTCGVLDVTADAPPRALPVTEIVPVKSPFFDYYAKYTAGACEEITPARISAEAAHRVQRTAVRVHRLIGCTGFSRSDMILEQDEPVWIEINTIPGMTNTSLFPQAAAKAGISFEQLVEALVQDALRRGKLHHSRSSSDFRNQAEQIIPFL